MKIKVRKIVTKKEKAIDENTGKEYEYTYQYENGYVNELEINPQEVTAFSTDKSIRLIGIEKQGLFPMTLKSWKETKKELAKCGVLQKLDYSKAS